ncbi:TPA: TonB-dependent receptor [Campylobacter coli]|nr:TonB-dependent receptor [Campylobacter coli]HEF1257224.1 TonB-dependent receptor [Campylobacter coli]HEH4747767.1 TonB-dependent receptor [Campylobacter coli]
MNPSKRVLKLSLLVFLLSTSINAQELNDKAIQMQKVVVSATGFEQDADSNLRNVIIIDGKDLEKKGFNTLEQALERISGISFVNFGLGRNIDMRGQGSKSNIAVKVMVNGNAINVLDNSHGITPLESINLNNIERIEIIPGGGSVLYGSGTRGGVVNIITKKQKSDAFALNLKGSSYDHGNLGGNLGVYGAKKINDYLTFGFDIQGFNRNGYQEGYSQKGYFANTKAHLNTSDNSDLTLSYNYFESKNTSSGYLTKAQVQSDPTQKGSNDNITQINRPEIALDYHHYFNDLYEIQFGAFWQNQKIRYLKDEIPMMSTIAYQTGSGFEDTLTGINLKNKINYKDDSYFIFGYEFANHDAKRTSLIYYSLPSVINYHKMTTLMDMNKQSHSVFALDSHQINDTFSISGGARYEFSSYNTNRSYRNEMSMNGRPPSPTIIDTTTLFNTDKNTHNFAFEITPNFKYSDTGNVYIKYERGFISPTPAQFVNRSNSNANGTPPYYSSNLKAEVFDTFELGISDFWWDFYGFNLTLFYTLSKDEISYLGNPHSTSGSWWKYYNIDQTRRLGAELNLHQYLFNDSLIIKESLSYLDAKISKGVNNGLRIPYVSKIKATAGVEYAWSKNFSSYIDLSYFSRAKDGGVINENTGKMSRNSWIKDYFLTDIGVNYNYKNLQILAGIRNLFDKKYYTYQDSINDQYLAGNGRNYYVEFKYAF